MEKCTPCWRCDISSQSGQNGDFWLGFAICLLSVGGPHPCIYQEIFSQYSQASIWLFFNDYSTQSEGRKISVLVDLIFGCSLQSTSNMYTFTERNLPLRTERGNNLFKLIRRELLNSLIFCWSRGLVWLDWTSSKMECASRELSGPTMLERELARNVSTPSI